MILQVRRWVLVSLMILAAPFKIFAGEILHLQNGELKIGELKFNEVKAHEINSNEIKINEYKKRSAPPADERFQSLSENLPTDSNQNLYYIVQFKNTITLADQAHLKNLGIDVLRYVPDDAYIVRTSVSMLNELVRTNSNAKDFVPYAAPLRVSAKLQMKSVFDKDVLQTVQIQFFKGVDTQALADKFEKNGWLVLEKGESAAVLQIPNREIQLLSNVSGVEWISKRSQMQLKDFKIPKDFLSNDAAVTSPDLSGLQDLTGYESGTKIMNFDSAWSLGLHGEGQIVGVSDTGLDQGDRTLLPKDFSMLSDTFILGYSSKTWADYVGHGTHVSGSIVNTGAQSNQKIMGGAFGAHLIMQSLWSQKYKTLTTPSDLKEIFQQAYDAGARIHSNSWGDSEVKGDYNAETAQVDEFVWNHPDMVILFAAGNEGVDANKDGRVDSNSISAPATAKNVITVGASENLVFKGGIQRKVGEIAFSPTDHPWPVDPLASDTLSNNAKGLAAFSSRGPTSDGRTKPDIVAPGTNIISNCSKMAGAGDLWGHMNENFCYSGGTSMSTPLTAAAAAVIRQRLLQMTDSPSAALIKAVMIHTANDLFPGQFGEVGEKAGQEILKHAPNSDEGYGLVDVGHAVTNSYAFFDVRDGVGTGETKYFDVPSQTTKVTLVYTDAPGAPAAKKALVNDLGLEVSVDGQVLKSQDDLNNSEQVIIPNNLAASKVSVVVRGINVPSGLNGKQPFALVYSNN
jgi:serine protease AprX